MTAKVEVWANSVAGLARRTSEAARILATLPDALRREALLAAADSLIEHKAQILEANEHDYEAARVQVETGEMSTSLFARLRTSDRGIREMAARVRQVANLPDPIGQILTTTAVDDE